MPSYSLQHGLASGNLDCGPLVVSQAGGTTTITNNPPGGSGQQTVTGWTYTPKANGGGTIMNPVPGDTLNLGGYTVTIGSLSYSFSSNATYRNAASGVRGGYFTAGASPTAGLDDWGAADPGPDPKY